MTKSEFILSLTEALAPLPGQDRRRAIEYYEEMIDDHIESGMTEEEAVAAMGSVEDILREAMPELNTAKEKPFIEYVDSIGDTVRIILDDAESIVQNAMRDLKKGFRQEDPSENVGCSFFTDPVHSIACNTACMDVRLAHAPLDGDKTVQIDYTLPENGCLHTSMENGMLKIIYSEKKKLGFSLRNVFFGGGNQIVVTLADPTLNSIELITSSGSSELSGLRVESATINGASGNISLENMNVQGMCSISASSGDISVTHSELGQLRSQCASGNAGLSYTSVQGECALNASSGDIRINGLKCQDILNAASSSGDVTLRDIGSAQVSAHTSSGDIDIQYVSCQAMSIASVSGDIDIRTIEGARVFQAETSSGDIDINGLHDGEILLKSISGDIDFADLSPAAMTINTSSGDIEGTLDGPADRYGFSAASRSGDIDIPQTRGPIPIEAHTISGDININIR